MRSRRRPVPLATLALSVSLWMALPSLEWCPFRWDDCGETCSDAEAVACGTPAAACGPDRAVACDASCTTACPASSPASAGGCDPSPDPIPFGDRAYCVHPPVDGLVVHPFELDPPGTAPLLATLVAPPAEEPPAVAAGRVAPPLFRPPPFAAPHAPPLARAPPLA